MDRNPGTWAAGNIGRVTSQKQSGDSYMSNFRSQVYFTPSKFCVLSKNTYLTNGKARNALLHFPLKHTGVHGISCPKLKGQVFISYLCCNKLPKIQQLETTHTHTQTQIYHFTLPADRSPRRVLTLRLLARLHSFWRLQRKIHSLPSPDSRGSPQSSGPTPAKAPFDLGLHPPSYSSHSEPLPPSL